MHSEMLWVTSPGVYFWSPTRRRLKSEPGKVEGYACTAMTEFLHRHASDIRGQNRMSVPIEQSSETRRLLRLQP
ncbi:hypothetical protein F2P81_019502 [Scophthalmus maximus]|uniref:Uncharacterized protein n=1 Tax=Scophthalmus maximus TaxID=52904 RepID=A0A6A4S802_SCOMX|nr:hypothetical protein F2P81_019502 [Scophthalmus maximus]